MNLPALITAFGLLAAPLVTEAQQSTKVPRIGVLFTSPSSTLSARFEAFREGLRELGYIEGKNIVIDWRSAEEKLERLPQLAAELVRLKVEIIVSGGPTSTHAAKEATVTIPIVMGFDSDPVGSGFVASLARPGGNITGLSSLAPEISGKRLELLKEIVPRLSRVAVFGTSTQAGNAQSLKETERAARAFGAKLMYLDILDRKDIETAFREARRWRADAALGLPSPVMIVQRKQVVDLAAKIRVPAIYQASEFVDAGGLMSYGPNFADLYRRAATYVDKILKGAKPADLPVEQPTKFELVINLKTAKALGLTIPQSILIRADQVIQ